MYEDWREPQSVYIVGTRPVYFDIILLTNFVVIISSFCTRLLNICNHCDIQTMLRGVHFYIQTVFLSLILISFLSPLSGQAPRQLMECINSTLTLV